MDVLVKIGEHPRPWINLIYLDDIAVTAGNKHQSAIGRNIEIAGMEASVLITDLLELATLRMDFEDSDTIGFESVARIEETPVGGEVNICPSLSADRVGCDDLDLLESSALVSEDGDCTRYLTHGIDSATVTREGQVARSRPTVKPAGNTKRGQLAGCIAEAQDGIGTEIRRQHFRFAEETGTVDMCRTLTLEIRASRMAMKELRPRT